jgi:two-component system response regulator MprA
MADVPVRNRVLVVDDNPAVRETFRRLLLQAGFQVVAVSSGAAALATLRDDPTIGLMLLDVGMPEVDGLTVRRAQLADPQLSSVPTVIVSGSADPRINSSDIRADDYLHKPVLRRQLLDVVSRYCRPERDTTH